MLSLQICSSRCLSAPSCIGVWVVGLLACMKALQISYVEALGEYYHETKILSSR
jgi:hypothetical protein